MTITAAAQHPRYDEALKMACGHFLSNVPDDMTGQQIIDALNQYYAEEIDDLPDDLVMWDRLVTGHDGCSLVVGLISSLAADFIQFIDHEKVCTATPSGKT